MVAIPNHLCAPGRPLVYVLHLNDVTLGRQWTVDQGPDDAGLVRLEFFLELDPAVLGQGGALITAHGQLLCDTNMRPLSYTTESAGRQLTVQFERDEVVATLPDGEKLNLEPGPQPCAVLENNILGHQALLTAGLRPDGPSSVAWRVLLVNQLLTLSYALERAPELDEPHLHAWRSSFKEELWLDARGGLVRWRHPVHGIRAELAVPPPPLPEWSVDGLPVQSTLRYVPPTARTFELRDVAINGPVTLIGATLTIPTGSEPHPAALFLGGSGRHDRHGISGQIDIGTHTLMDSLAERGILGLRCDTRGAGTTKLGPDTLEQGLQTIFDDAAAALDYLRGCSEVGGHPVWLIGHSQGAIVALALAQARPQDVAGLVLLAAPGRAIDQLMHDQIQEFGERMGLSSDQIAAQQRELQEFVTNVRCGGPWSEDTIPAHVMAGARSRRWLEEHLRFRADELLAATSKPVLLCQGGKDLQVSPERDAERLRAVARQAGVDLEYALFPNLDHLFKPVEGEPDTRLYFDASREVDPTLVATIADWIEAKR